jgi:UDP:flavonoid glycosyltransferase YjiC (YdhE family)
MTHFGIICPAATGHINTMFPLAHALQQRGHQITHCYVMMYMF